MILSINYKFIYIHIPKAAGEWLTNKLRKSIRWDSQLIAYWGLDLHNDLDITHVHQKIANRYMPEPLFIEFFKFTICRNPYNRFYSAFKDIPAKIKSFGHKNRFWIDKYPEFETIDEFCKIVEEQAINDKITRHNIHIIPQYEFILLNGKVNIQKIIKYEEMDKELPKLMDYLKIPYSKSHSNNNKILHFTDINSDNLNRSYIDKLTPKAIALINRLYKKDFEILGYKMIQPNQKINRSLKRKNINPFLKNIDNELYPYKNGFIINNITNYYSNINYGFHAKIVNNQLTIIKDFGSYQSRNKNTILMIKDVLKKYKLPNTEFLVNTDDMLKSDIDYFPVFTMARRKHQPYLTYPDHTFYKWDEAKTDSWENERKVIMNKCKKINKKINKIMFRGANTHYIREYLSKSLSRSISKKRLEMLMRIMKKSSLFDIQIVDVNKKNQKFVKLSDHCKWKYLLHIPGISYAARLKYLMMTNSLVFYIHKNTEYEYKEFWYSQLHHMGNCIFIRDTNIYNQKNRAMKKDGKWDDESNKYIVKQIHDYIKLFEKDTKQYHQIIKNGEILRNTFTYENILEYWYVLIKKYSKLVKL